MAASIAKFCCCRRTDSRRDPSILADYFCSLTCADCKKTETAVYTLLPPPLKPSGRNDTEVSAAQRLFTWLHSGFGAILTSREMPQGIKEEGSITPDLLFPLVLQSPGPVIFTVFALLLTVAVPLSGLAVLRKRCKDRPEEKATSFTNPPDSVGKTTFFLWILLLCLTMMCLGALAMMRHASMALDAAAEQQRYLAKNLPVILTKPSQDLALIAGENIDEFSKAIDQRIKGKHVLKLLRVLTPLGYCFRIP
nr:uncharacterized protein LOC126529170 [Dermacentor andersoni]